MSIIAQYDATAILAGRSGTTKKDDNGYFEMALGAFDIMNAQGQFYPFTQDLKGMFEPGTDLNRRLESGKARGEQGHPRIQDGQSFQSFLNRWKTVYDTNICVHVKSVRLEWQKNAEGRNIVVCYGMIKGSGPFGNHVNLTLENPDENAAMSIRSIVDPVSVRGVTHRRITLIICWDWVNEPGISLATKYGTPSMESLESGRFNQEMLEMAAETERKEIYLGAESKPVVGYDMIRTGLGWQKVETICVGKSTNWM